MNIPPRMHEDTKEHEDSYAVPIVDHNVYPDFLVILRALES